MSATSTNEPIPVPAYVRHTVTCPSCGDEIELERDPRGESVICLLCGDVFKSDATPGTHLEIDCPQCPETFDVEVGNPSPITCPECGQAVTIAEER